MNCLYIVKLITYSSPTVWAAVIENELTPSDQSELKSTRYYKKALHKPYLKTIQVLIRSASESHFNLCLWVVYYCLQHLYFRALWLSLAFFHMPPYSAHCPGTHTHKTTECLMPRKCMSNHVWRLDEAVISTAHTNTNTDGECGADRVRENRNTPSNNVSIRCNGREIVLLLISDEWVSLIENVTEDQNRQGSHSTIRSCRFNVDVIRVQFSCSFLSNK